MEVWKNIDGYENYQVSNLGNIKSLNYNHTGVDRIMKPSIIRGYCQVQLFQDRIVSRKYVHRLVAQAFIPNPENKPEIDHINTIRTDNRVENLQWATPKENQNNPLTKIKMSGENHCQYGKKGILSTNYGKLGILNPKSIPVLQYSKSGKFIAEFAGIREAERMTNINSNSIGRVCKYKSKTAGGYIWKYKNN